MQWCLRMLKTTLSWIFYIAKPINVFDIEVKFLFVTCILFYSMHIYFKGSKFFWVFEQLQFFHRNLFKYIFETWNVATSFQNTHTAKWYFVNLPSLTWSHRCQSLRSLSDGNIYLCVQNNQHYQWDYTANNQHRYQGYLYG